MAARVISSCPSRRAKSQDHLDKVILGRDTKETDKFVLDLLSQLPPSKELLQHYQAKLEKYEQEEGQLLARIDACAQLLDNGKRLEREIEKSQTEIEGLKDDLEAVSIKLHEEKRVTLKLSSENDQLRIRDVENQRKIRLLMKMCNKTEAEIVKQLNRDRNPSQDEKDLESHPRLKQLKSQSSFRQSRSYQTLELEVANLEQQLLDQERLHKTQLKEERLLWRKAEKIHVQDKHSLREKVGDVQGSVSGLETHIGVLTQQLAKQRTEFRKHENKWLNDRAMLMRKIEFFEKYGTLEGTHTEQRLKARVTGEKGSKDKIVKLEAEIESKDREVQKNRADILHLKNEIFKEKAKSEAAANILAKKTKTMTEQVNVLHDRCERTEKRKAVEIEGYQSDIKILKGKLSTLENKLLAVAEGSRQEDESKHILEALRTELKNAERRRPREWKD